MPDRAAARGPTADRALGASRVALRRLFRERESQLQRILEDTLHEGAEITLVDPTRDLGADDHAVLSRRGAQFDARFAAIATHFPTTPAVADKVELRDGAVAREGSVSGEYFRMPPRDLLADRLAYDDSGELKELTLIQMQQMVALGYRPYMCIGEWDTEPSSSETQGCYHSNFSNLTTIADELLRTSCASMRRTGTLLSPAAIAARRSMYVYTGLTLDAQNRCATKSNPPVPPDAVQEHSTTVPPDRRCVAVDAVARRATLYDLRGTLPLENLGVLDQYRDFRIQARRINVTTAVGDGCGDAPDPLAAIVSTCAYSVMQPYRAGTDSTVNRISDRPDPTGTQCEHEALDQDNFLQHHEVVNYGMEVAFADRIALTAGVPDSPAAWFAKMRATASNSNACQLYRVDRCPYVSAAPPMFNGQQLLAEPPPADTIGARAEWINAWQNNDSWKREGVSREGGRRWGVLDTQGTNGTRNYNPVMYVYGLSTTRGRVRLRSMDDGRRAPDYRYRRYRPYLKLATVPDWGPVMQRSASDPTLDRWDSETCRAPGAGSAPVRIPLDRHALRLLDDLAPTSALLDQAFIDAITELKDDKRRVKEGNQRFIYQILPSRSRRNEFVDRFPEFD